VAENDFVRPIGNNPFEYTNNGLVCGQSWKSLESARSTGFVSRMRDFSISARARLCGETTAYRGTDLPNWVVGSTSPIDLTDSLAPRWIKIIASPGLSYGQWTARICTLQSVKNPMVRWRCSTCLGRPRPIPLPRCCLQGYAAKSKTLQQ